MGGGRWDTKLYETHATTRAAAGVDDFAYHADTMRKPPSARRVHEDLDPMLIKGIRESRDSAEHPDSLAIAVFFDVTGSMREIPQVLQKKLGFLMEFVIGKGGVEHPQILTGAIGDATCDRFPFQIGQFESDNRLDEQLRLLILEGNGGGQCSESYGLAFYAAARKTACDCFEKRGRKGYLFTIGDEMSWPVTRDHAHKIFGDTIQSDLSIEELVRAAQEQWHVFHIIPRDAAHGRDENVLKFWRDLLGQSVMRIDDAALICELIAGQIALSEGAEFDDIRKVAGESVAKELVTVPPPGGGGWNAPTAQISGTPLAPPGSPGAVDRF